MTAPTATATTTTAPRFDWRALAVREGGYLAELAALCGVVFARPVLASFGESPETFIAKGVDGAQVALFALAVLLLPIMCVALPAALGGFAGPRVRSVTHLVALGLLGWAGGVQLLRVNTHLSPGVVAVLAAPFGAGLAGLRWRVDGTQTFLRYAGLASVVFVVQFLAFSPAGSLVRGGRSAGVDDDVTAAVEAAVGEDPPPVVMIVLDALPTTSLLDGEGYIREDVYPNLAALADDGTWYRNHTTVAQETPQAVPAMLSGDVPDGLGVPPVASAYSDNLFTLLGGVYDMDVVEPVTALCPRSLCPGALPESGMSMMRDAYRLWWAALDPEGAGVGLPGAFGDRYEELAAWVDAQDFGPSERPRLHFYHSVLPHEPWAWLPGGTRYQASVPARGMWAGRWSDNGWDVGIQRQVLQMRAVDEQLGQLFGRMREAGVYDDALVVVTADHGAAFTPGGSHRGLDESQFEQIMWTPLIIKQPGQRQGEIDDSNVQSIDVLPAMADALGVDLVEDLGWEVDGLAPGEATARDPGDKSVLDWDIGTLHPPDDEDMVTVDGQQGFERVLEADIVEGRGALAGWQRTAYGELLDRPVGELTEGEAATAPVELAGLEQYQAVDFALPLPVELHGRSWLPPGEVVAVSLNGTIAGLAEARPAGYGTTAVDALVWPGPLVEGANEVRLYQVTGPVDDPTLRRLPIGPL